MPAVIYSIQIQGKRDNLPQPHLLVVEVGDNCLAAPAFTSGGHELTELLESFAKAGVFAHECSAEIDNSKHAVFHDGRPGYIATWVVAKRQVLSKSFLASQKQIGIMDDHGLLEIVEAILRWNFVRPENLPPKQVRTILKLKDKLMRDLAARSAPSSVKPPNP